MLEWFADPAKHGLVQWIVSIIALALSAFSIVLGWRSTRRDADIQSRLLKIEEERQEAEQRDSQSAKLRAYIEKTGRHDYRLIVENHGAGTARQVRTVIDDVPVSEHEAIIDGSDEIRSIGPQSDIGFIASLTMGGKNPPWNVRLQWRDDSGRQGAYESTVTT